MEQENTVKPMDWDFLIKTIKRQRCVLFLGPEIFVNANGESLQQQFYQTLAEQNPDKILAYNKEDGFFLFTSPQAKTRIFINIVDFFEQNFDENLLTKIVEIPFHAIVSINPDNTLTKLMQKFGIDHTFDYYDRKQKKDISDSPTKDKPLVYNLLGNVAEEETLILTHDDLYEYFRALMGNNQLPLELRAVLESALDYVFLGFQFDKWYVQLLMSLLNLHDEKYQFIRFASLQKMRTDTQSLCIKHFKIEFIDNNVLSFVDSLYQKCQSENLLRPLKQSNAGTNALLSANQLRVNELSNQLERQIKLLGELNKKLDTETRPKEIMNLEDEIEAVKQRMEQTENELKNL